MRREKSKGGARRGGAEEEQKGGRECTRSGRSVEEGKRREEALDDGRRGAGERATKGGRKEMRRKNRMASVIEEKKMGERRGIRNIKKEKQRRAKIRIRP